MKDVQKLLSVAAVLLCCELSLFGQDPPLPPASDKAPADVIKALGEQEPAHRQLARLRGEWDLERTDVEVRGEGESSFRSLSLGNFLEEDLEFGGGNLGILVHAVYGYDQHHEHYTATWYTSFSTIPFQGTAAQEAEMNRFNFRLAHPLMALRQEEKFFYRITILDPSRLKLQLLVQKQDGAESVIAAFLATKRESAGRDE